MGHQASYTHGLLRKRLGEHAFELSHSVDEEAWLTSSTSIREGLIEEGVDLKSYRVRRRGRGRETRPEEQHSESSRQEQ